MTNESPVSKGKKIEALYAIADISCSTRFLVSHKDNPEHAQIIMAELLRMLASETESIFTLAEIEGDAVFFYTIKDEDESTWKERKETIVSKLETLPDVFDKKIQELKNTLGCDCSTCVTVEDLSLKVVVHYGPGRMISIGPFCKILGLSVYFVHMLLKNTVPGNEYILFSKDAHKELDALHSKELIEGEESYDNYGVNKVFYYYPHKDEHAQENEDEQCETRENYS